MLNRVRYLAETSLGVASFEDMDLGEGHAESPLLIVTLSRSTCAISGFSCLLGRPSKSVGFTRRMDMACMKYVSAYNTRGHRPRAMHERLPFAKILSDRSGGGCPPQPC